MQTGRYTSNDSIDFDARARHQLDGCSSVSHVILRYATDPWGDLCGLIYSVGRQKPPIDAFLIVV